MSVSSNTVLIIDDDVAGSRATAQSLSRRRYSFDVIFASNESEALEQLREHSPEAIVLDLSLSEERGPQSGLELLEVLQREDPSLRVLILTGHDAKEFGLESLRRGAASFLTKPVDVEHLGALLRDAIHSTQLRRTYFGLSHTPQTLQSLTGLMSRNEVMKKVIEQVAYAGSHTQPVFLAGETGVGKGVIAQAIHRSSPRRSRPFIRVQPRFGSPDLSASEIFGHERGAFTGANEVRKGLIEEANGGTLFLDEVDEFPLETQILLLNALQERVFRRLGSNKENRSDFRLITATNRNVDDTLREGKLRRDFYHRIAHLTIEIPPLRARLEDIPDLANDYFRELSNRENLDVQGIAPSAMDRLFQYRWPGNVRELFAVIEGGAYRAEYEGRRFVEAKDFVFQEGAKILRAQGSFREQVRQFEARLLTETLSKFDNNQSKAASYLQLDRSTIRRLLRRRGAAGF